MHQQLNTASISFEQCTIPDEKLEHFSAYAEGISVADLEEEITNFKDGNAVRNQILRFISQRTEWNLKFPLGGHITGIGSSWDGTKVGHLDEVDTLYVLNKGQVNIIPGKNGEVDIERFRVEWKGKAYSAGELNVLFANELDQALRTEPPQGMEHNGYAAPRYSGIRVSGPAVTVLFRTAAKIGRMEKGSMISVDITLALPFSYIKSEQQAPIYDLNEWFTRYISSTNDKPIDAVEPHVIPCRFKQAWKPTTAHIEANALHELEKDCALKRAHILLKCLMKKVDKFSCEHRLFHCDIKTSPARVFLIDLLEKRVKPEDIDEMNRCMRHGYIFLSPEEIVDHNELRKKNASINAAAAKQILFQIATEEDYMPGCADQTRAFTLMKTAIADIAMPGTLFVKNHIYHSFPPICKVSIRETLSDKCVELASTLLRQYNKLSSSISALVSTQYVNNVGTHLRRKN